MWIFSCKSYRIWRSYLLINLLVFKHKSSIFNFLLGIPIKIPSDPFQKFMWHVQGIIIWCNHETSIFQSNYVANITKNARIIPKTDIPKLCNSNDIMNSQWNLYINLNKDWELKHLRLLSVAAFKSHHNIVWKILNLFISIFLFSKDTAIRATTCYIIL